MADLNSFTLTGRLVRDAEQKRFPVSGSVFLSFSVANNTGFGQYQKANFFKVTLIGKAAESLQQYLKKGQAVGLTGTLETNSWTGSDGVNHSDWQLTTASVILLGGKQGAKIEEEGVKEQEQRFRDEIPY